MINLKNIFDKYNEDSTIRIRDDIVLTPNDQKEIILLLKERDGVFTKIIRNLADEISKILMDSTYLPSEDSASELESLLKEIE